MFQIYWRPRLSRLSEVEHQMRTTRTPVARNTFGGECCSGWRGERHRLPRRCIDGHAASNCSIEIAFAFSRISLWLMCCRPIGAAMAGTDPAASYNGPVLFRRRTTVLQRLQSPEPLYPGGRPKGSELHVAGLGADRSSAVW